MTAEEQSKFSDLPGYAGAVRFREEFVPLDGHDYTWVSEYAVERYKELIKDFELIDAKAAFVITTLSAGIGAVTVSSLAFPATVSAIAIALLVFPFFAAAMAIRYAYLSRTARDMPAGPTVERAANYVNYYQEKSRVLFLGQLNFMNEMTKETNDIKAILYNTSVEWAIGAVILTVIPFAAAVISRFS